jgi:hypothetical protein
MRGLFIPSLTGFRPKPPKKIKSKVAKDSCSFRVEK